MARQAFDIDGLKRTIEEIGNFEYQERTWLNIDNDPVRMSSPSEMISMLLDDLKFEEFVRSYSGHIDRKFLYNLLSAIEDLPDSVFTDDPRVIINSLPWKRVRSAAYILSNIFNIR